MEKNIRLADIYIKIYNKQPLMMEDLAFLARYDRECFEKTCRNLIYNMPEAKDLLQPAQPEKTALKTGGSPDTASPKDTPGSTAADSGISSSAPDPASVPDSGSQSAEPNRTSPQINTLLDNLKKMEWQEMPIPHLDAGKVKNLLGSLYMELLFPHNDRYRHFNLEDGGHSSVFNKKV